MFQYEAMEFGMIYFFSINLKLKKQVESYQE